MQTWSAAVSGHSQLSDSVHNVNTLLDLPSDIPSLLLSLLHPWLHIEKKSLNVCLVDSRDP